MTRVFLDLLYLFIFLFCASCVDKHFIIYSVTGEQLRYEQAYKNTSGILDFKLYFNKDEINVEYSKIHIIATDYFYYGQFFFDTNFMSMLKSKTQHIGADALLYERNRIDYPNFDENFLYFTAIKYENIPGE